jgi:hypothetical protein
MRNAIAEDGKRYRSPSIGDVFRRTEDMQVHGGMRDSRNDVRLFTAAHRLNDLYEDIAMKPPYPRQLVLSVAERLEKLTYNLEDVKLFIDLATRRGNYFGEFLFMALDRIMAADDVFEFTLNAPEMSFLGRYFRRGIVVINGNPGHLVGQGMTGGTIIVNGDVAHGAGIMMEGGYLQINGNAGPKVGQAMSGGLVVVKGNAETHVGCNMRGGIIRVHGTIDADHSGENVTGGQIFVGGTLYKPAKSERKDFK